MGELKRDHARGGSGVDPARIGAPRPSTYRELLRAGPDWLAYDVDLRARRLQFVPMSEYAYFRAVFLDDRIEPAAPGSVRCPLPPDCARSECDRHGYVFHSSFCGSTLLTTVLQNRSTFLCLREPLILRRLSDAQAAVAPSDRPAFGPDALKACVAPLTRSYRANQSVLIKPSNMALNLIAPLLRLDPRAQALFLYDDLESYLVSCLKKNARTQAKMPWLASRLLRSVADKDRLAGFLNRASDPVLHPAAIVWHLQMVEFERALERFGARAASLSFQRLLAAPRRTITAAARLFRADVRPGRWNRLLNFNALKRNAKDPALPYSTARRRAERELVLRTYRRRIEAALKWSRPLLGERSATPELPHPLRDSPAPG